MANSKVLVVDDSATQLMMYKMALTKEGYDVSTANNGVEGINLVYSDNFDLIISDIVMPEINGYVFCRLIKNDPLKSHVPIILLSGLGQQQDRFWGLEAGASAFITKDINTANLISEVKKQLRTKVNSAQPFQAHSLHNIQSETNTDLRTKIFQILDKLLFESSVSNKIREIVRYAYDNKQMVVNLFRLLSNLVEYSVASIAFKTKANNLISFEITGKVSQNNINDIMKKTLKGEDPKTFIINVLGKNKIVDEEIGEFKSELIVPLIDNEKWVGFVGLFDFEEHKYSEDDFKILTTYARELVMIIQFISKMSEMDEFRNEITNTLMNDLIQPLNDNKDLLLTLKSDDVSPDMLHDITDTLVSNIEKTINLSEELTQVLKKIKHEDIS